MRDQDILDFMLQMEGMSNESFDAAFDHLFITKNIQNED